MSCCEEQRAGTEGLTEVCGQTRANFSAYLDGALDGLTMGQLASHMRECASCSHEFQVWRSMQEALSSLGPAQVPSELQARLRDALASEISTKRHLSPWQQVQRFWHECMVPACLRFGAGLAATVVILGSGAWVLGTALPVQANDDRLAHMNAPKFLYSQAAPEAPVVAANGARAVLVDAKVDADGRVYDFDLIDGPKDAQTRLWVEANLLGSVFRPATVFGAPVRGHAMMMMTYTTVSAKS